MSNLIKSKTITASEILDFYCYQLEKEGFKQNTIVVTKSVCKKYLDFCFELGINANDLSLLRYQDKLIASNTKNHKVLFKKAKSINEYIEKEGLVMNDKYFAPPNQEIIKVSNTPLELIANYYYGQTDIKPKSLKSYKVGINSFIEFVNPLDLHPFQALSKESTLKYKAELGKKLDSGALSSFSSRLYIASVKALAKFVYENFEQILKRLDIEANTKQDFKQLEIWKQNIRDIRDIQGTRIDNEEIYKKPVLEKDFAKMLKLTKEKKHKALLGLLYYGCLRISEVTHVNAKDFSTIKDANGKTKDILYIRGKGRDSKDKFIIVENKLKKLLEGTSKDFTDFTIQSIDRFVNTLYANIGIKERYKITCHSLRHGGAYRLLKLKNNDLLYLKNHLRHKSVDTTQKYIKSIEKEQYLTKSDF